MLKYLLAFLNSSVSANSWAAWSAPWKFGILLNRLNEPAEKMINNQIYCFNNLTVVLSLPPPERSFFIFCHVSTRIDLLVTSWTATKINRLQIIFPCYFFGNFSWKIFDFRMIGLNDFIWKKFNVFLLFICYLMMAYTHIAE